MNLLRASLIGIPISLYLWALILDTALRLAPEPKPAGVWAEKLP